MVPGETGSVVGALGGWEVLFLDGVFLCSGAVIDPGEVDTDAGAAPTGEEGSRLCSETQRYCLKKKNYFHRLTPLKWQQQDNRREMNTPDSAEGPESKITLQGIVIRYVFDSNSKDSSWDREREQCKQVHC